MQNTQQRESVVYQYGPLKGLSSKQYQKDLKKRQEQGWNLVSCAESGRCSLGHTILTAIYEKGDASQQPSMNVQNLSLLLSMLTEQERSNFESEVQSIVNRYLAAKATGQ